MIPSVRNLRVRSKQAIKQASRQAGRRAGRWAGRVRQAGKHAVRVAPKQAGKQADNEQTESKKTRFTHVSEANRYKGLTSRSGHPISEHMDAQEDSLRCSCCCCCRGWYCYCCWNMTSCGWLKRLQSAVETIKRSNLLGGMHFFPRYGVVVVVVVVCCGMVQSVICVSSFGAISKLFIYLLLPSAILTAAVGAIGTFVS